MSKDSHVLFAQDIIKSQAPTYTLANWWDSRGVAVYLPHFGEVPTNPLSKPDPNRIPDGGKDLLIGRNRQRVEVKHRRDMTFTTVEQFPFPTVIVDVAHKINNDGPASLYCFVNGPMTHCLFLRTSRTQQFWTQGRQMDHRIGRERPYYYCSTRHLSCLEITTKKDTIVPQWIVYPNGQDSNIAGAGQWQMRILEHDPFDGDHLAPIIAQAQQAHYRPVLVPIRIGRWENQTYKRVESRIPWPKD